MEAFGDQRRLGKAARARDNAPLKRGERSSALRGDQLAESGMQAQDMVDRRAEGRLPAVNEPMMGCQRGEMRSPDPIDESRLIGNGHATR